LGYKVFSLAYPFIFITLHTADQKSLDTLECMEETKVSETGRKSVDDWEACASSKRVEGCPMCERRSPGLCRSLYALMAWGNEEEELPKEEEHSLDMAGDD
jgi:hypothetical protein